MKTRTKVLLGIAGVLLLAIGAGTLWVYYALGPLMATTIRTFAPNITGVTVRLDKVDLAPLKGTVDIRGLVVGNPEGFQTEHALSLGEINMTVRLRSIFSPVIVIEHILIDKPDIIYEIGGAGSNLDAIQQHVDRYVAEHFGGGTPKVKESAGPKNDGKKVVIEKLLIKRAMVHVSATILQGKDMAVPLPDLRLQDIGKDSNGATAGEAVKQVLGALTKSVGTAVATLHLGDAAGTAKEGTGSILKTIKGLIKKP